MAAWEDGKGQGCTLGCDGKRTTSLVRRHSSASSGTWSLTSAVTDAQARLRQASVLTRSSAGSQRSALGRKSASRTSAKSRTSSTGWPTAVSTTSALSSASATSRKSAINSGSATDRSKFARTLHRRHTAPDLRRSNSDDDSTSGGRESDSDDDDGDGYDVASDASSSVPDITRQSEQAKSVRRQMEIDDMVQRLVRPTIASRARSALSASQRQRILQMVRRKRESGVGNGARKPSPSDNGDYQYSGRFLGTRTVSRHQMEHIVSRLHRDRAAEGRRSQNSAALINSKVGIFASYYNLGSWIHRKLNYVHPTVTETVISYCRSRIRDLDDRQRRGFHQQTSVA